MDRWLTAAMAAIIPGWSNEDGQADAFLIALLIFLFIILISGRRLFVQ